MVEPAHLQPQQALTALPQWRALSLHHAQTEHLHLREFFVAHRSRGERLVAEAAGLYPDYSKNRIADETGLAFRRCVVDGNRPSNAILAERLTPQTLGVLVALYEHSVLVQGSIRNIDSFDQWCVELGMAALATRIAAEIASPAEPELPHDSSTNALIRRYRALRGARK